MTLPTPAEALLPVAVGLTEPVVLVTSAEPAEGASEVALGLKRALGLAGQSASAIDAEAGGLGLPRTGALVEAARERADVVVIAGPPAAVAAAGPAEVLLVARLGVTRSDELRRALCALTAAGAAPVGVVATTAPPRGPHRSAETRSQLETASEVTVG